MSESTLKKPKIRQALSDFSRRVETLARAWPVGAVLAVGGMGFAITTWEAPSVDLLNDRWPLHIGASLLTYFTGVGWLALASTRSFALAPAAAAGQLFKYVPGGLWQLQPVARADSLSAVGRVITATVFSAAVPLLASGSGWLASLGAGTLLVAALWAHKKWGVRQTGRLIAFGLLAAVFISLSGGFVASALDRGILVWSRRIGTAWGTGVLVAPVPAGFGIRETVLAAISPGSDAALIAAFHRAITIVVDVCVGLSAWLWMRARFPATPREALQDNTRRGCPGE